MSFENVQTIKTRTVLSRVLASALVTLSLASVPLTSWSQDGAETVKMSASGICHDVTSRHYARVKSYKPYESMQACLADGGREPKK